MGKYIVAIDGLGGSDRGEDVPSDDGDFNRFIGFDC